MLKGLRGYEKRRSRMVAGAVLATMGACSSLVHATARLWAPPNASSQLWSTASNWSPSGAAANGDTLTFAGIVNPGTSGSPLTGTIAPTSITFDSTATTFFLSANQQNASLTLTQNSANPQSINYPIKSQSNDRTLTLAGTGTGLVTFSGLLSEQNHSVIVNKSGSSSFILSANNTYSGATTISGGTLAINGTLTGAGGNVEINSGGKLAGNSTNIARIINVNNGGTISPNNDTPNTGGSNASIGRLSASSAEFKSGGKYLFEIGNVAGTPGDANIYDSITLSGAITVSSTSGTPFTIKLVSHGAAAGWNNTSVYHWDIVTAGSVSGFTNSNQFVLDTGDFTDDNPDSGSGVWVVDGDSTHLRVSHYVPEPGSGAMVGLAAAGLLRRRRRR